MSAHTTNVPFFGAMRHAGVVHYLMEMITLHRQREELSQLDDRMLDDIGITREEAAREASRPSWDVPDRWRR